ncbi:LamB/YcsF family protein [Bosea sp. UC22_33]|uniref:LamB/YcsF family protein n=1 Tax=Bosea sp. UC22_33 TaxID=3350165 RepID=UPI003670DB5A
MSFRRPKAAGEAHRIISFDTDLLESSALHPMRLLHARPTDRRRGSGGGTADADAVPGGPAYDTPGNLVPRKVANSVITSPEAVAKRVGRFLDDGTVETMDGKSIRGGARSIPVHRDTPGSVTLARTVRSVIARGGGRIVRATELPTWAVTLRHVWAAIREAGSGPARRVRAAVFRIQLTASVGEPRLVFGCKKIHDGRCIRRGEGEGL